MKTLDINYVRKTLSFNKDTGSLIWNYNENAYKGWNQRFAGKPALNSPNHKGYLVGSIGGSVFMSHRVAWAHHYGFWPESFIDHINRDKTDNRISNLRLATIEQSNQNREKHKVNTSGYKGVSFSKSRGLWEASIKWNGKSKFLGRFSRKEDARDAYIKASIERHGDFSSEI